MLEQGIMVQKELESQATQLLDHCQYGLEQVEAEKLLLVAGRFVYLVSLVSFLSSLLLVS